MSHVTGNKSSYIVRDTQWRSIRVLVMKGGQELSGNFTSAHHLSARWRCHTRHAMLCHTVSSYKDTTLIRRWASRLLIHSCYAHYL